MKTFAETLTNQFMPRMNAERLEKEIQGAPLSNAENVILAFNFKGIINKRDSDWMKQWIRNSDPEMVKQFFIAATGKLAIQLINIQKPDVSESKKSNNDLVFSTCGKAVTIDFDQFFDYESFAARLPGSSP